MVYKAWLEEWIYFLLVWDRWIDNWYETREKYFTKDIPFYPIRVIIFNIIWRKLSLTLYWKGITRHSREEIISFIAESAKVLSEFVGEKGLFDGKPCSVNAIVSGLLISVYELPELNKTSYEEFSKYPNLRRWTESMVAKYFPERKLAG